LLIRKFLVDNIDNKKKNKSDKKVRGSVKFEILGRFESAGADSNPTNKDRIIFEATSENPIVIEVNRLFIKKVTISGVRVEIGGLGNKGAPDTPFEIDGDLKLEKLPAGGDLLQINMSKPIRFEKLRLPLIPGSAAVDWEWPSLALPVKQARPLRLGPIGFSIERIGFGLPEVFDGGLDILGHDLDLEKGFPWIDLKIGLFKYPELNPKAGLPFGFNLVLGVPDIANGKVKATLKGLDFDKLDIDLFRFIRLKAKNFEIGSPSGPLGGEVNTLSWLLAQDVELEILGRKIVDKLSVYVVSRGGKYAFIAYLEDVFDGELVSINWVLLANSWPLGPVAPLLLGLQDATSGDLYKAIKKQVVAAASNPGLIVGGHMAGRWGFGLGLSIMKGVFRVKLLVMDGGTIGLMIDALLLRRVFGIEGIAVAYIRGNTPEEDQFWVEIGIPGFRMTAFNFLGGRFGLRAFLNGSFEFDVGFPWLQSGIRRWDRGLGFNVGIYVGHAGCYIRYLNQRSADGNGREITVGGGLGLAVGYGRSFDFSVVKAYVGIEIYAILEGNFTFKISGLPALPGSRGTSSRELSTHDGGLPDLDLKSLELRGIIGIVVCGSAELDVWVLHVRFEVHVFAESETRLTYDLENPPALVQFSFRFGMTYSGACKVGSGWFSFTFEVSVRVTMEFQGEIEL